jgi:hypothetical protein
LGGKGAVADTKEKIISYRRAEWLIDNPTSATLSGLLKQAIDKLQTASERTVSRGDQEMILASLKPDESSAFFLHITLDTPGEAASIVPKTGQTASEIKVGTSPPPKDAEYMDGDAFVYICGNDVVLCATGVQDTTIAFYLRELFKKAHLRHDADKFELMKVADISKLRLLHRQGVKEVELKATVSEAASHYVRRKNTAMGIAGTIAKHVKAICANEYDVNEDSLRVLITIKTDGRRKGLALGEKRIELVAEDLIKNQEDEDEFVIVTKTDQRIGPKEIFVRTKTKIQSHGKSVQKDKVWDELIKFYADLKSAEVLE